MNLTLDAIGSHYKHITMVHITNVVYTANVGCHFDLRELANKLTNVVYNPRKMSVLVWQHRSILSKCLLFKTGNICSNGCNSVVKAKKVVRQYARILQKLGYAIKLNNMKVVTRSAAHTLDGKINYNEIVKDLGAEYNPELFHAALLKKGKVNFTVFRSGKVVITGVKTNAILNNVVYPTIIELELYAHL